MFDQRLQQKIDKRVKQGDGFEYTEGFSSEVQTFVHANYDLNNYNVDFKALAK